MDGEAFGSRDLVAFDVMRGIDDFYVVDHELV